MLINAILFFFIVNMTKEEFILYEPMLYKLIYILLGLGVITNIGSIIIDIMIKKYWPKKEKETTN